MALGVGAARRDAAFFKIEAQRQALLDEQTKSEDEAYVAEFIQIGGGASAHAITISGAYQRIIEDSDTAIVYQRLDPVSCDFCSKGPFLELRAVDHEKYKQLWVITDAPGGKKIWARNKDASGCPSRILRTWKIKDTAEHRFVEDADFRVVEIPLGFCLTTAPLDETEIELIKDGPAAGTEVHVYVESDESQIRRLSPRASIILPASLGGRKCRGKTELIRADTRNLDDSDKDEIWNIYKQLRNILTARLDATYFYFHPCSPTLFYRKLDAEIQVPNVSFHGSSLPSPARSGLTKSSQHAPLALQNIEDEIVSREEDGDDPGEPVTKRRRIEKDSERSLIGSNEDPFMKSISRDDPRPGTSGRVASQSRSDVRRPEASTIAADFRALRRHCAKTRKRILSEATWRPWYSELIQMGTVSCEATDDQLDEIWVWSIALQQSDDIDAGVRPLLVNLAIQSMCGSVDRLRPVLARLLCLCESLPPLAARHDACSSESCILDIACELLQRDWPVQEDLSEEVKMLGSCAKFSTLTMAKAIFKPGAKPLKNVCSWHQSLVCFAFGVVFSSKHIAAIAPDGLDGKTVACLLTNVSMKLTQDISGIVWVRLAALHIGVAAHLRQSSELADLCKLAQAAPKELEGYLKGLRLHKRPRRDPAPSDVTTSSQPDVEGAGGERHMPATDSTSAKVDAGTPADIAEAVPDNTVEVQPCPPTVAPNPVVDPSEDLRVWRTSAAQTLDGIVEKIHGERIASMSSEQLWELYGEIVPAGQGGSPSANIRHAVEVEAGKAGTASTSWRFVCVGDRLRKGVADWVDVEPGSDKIKERKHFFLRAFHFYQALLCLSDLPVTIRAVVKLRQAETRKLLDEVDLSDGRNPSRAGMILQDTIEAKQLLCHLSLEQLSESLLALWKSPDPQPRVLQEPASPTAAHAKATQMQPQPMVKPTAPPPSQPTPTTTHGDGEVKLQPQPMLNPTAPPPSQPIPTTTTHGQPSAPPQPRPIVKPSAPSRPQPTPTTIHEDVTHLKPKPEVKPTAPSTTHGEADRSTALAHKQQQLRAPVHAVEQAPAHVSTQPVRSRLVDIKDLRPGLYAAWCLIVRVLQMIPFRTGGGFQAILGDGEGSRIAAFFFREAASKHAATVRVGVRLQLVVASTRTHVRKSDPKYGGSLQLVIGNDASISVERFRLGRLPLPNRIEVVGYDGPVEIVGIITCASDLLIAENGTPYRKMLIVDETCTLGVDWICWGSFATGLPDVLVKGTLVHIKATDLLWRKTSRGRRPHIRNGEPVFPQRAEYDERMEELMEWAQQYFCL